MKWKLISFLYGFLSIPIAFAVLFAIGYYTPMSERFISPGIFAFLVLMLILCCIGLFLKFVSEL